MAVIFNGKMVFLEHPRTGSTSVRDALKKIGGQPFTRHEYVAAKRGELTVAAVRNPFDVLVSWYLIIGERQGYNTFKDFLLGCHDQFMTKHGRLFYYHKHVDIFIHYENLQAELNGALRRCGLPSVRLHRYNRTKGKQAYQSYYDDETSEIVRSRFRAELEEYGYGMEPGSQARGGGTNEKDSQT